ncbi:MAG: PASTA domain-containing protein [Gaiellaceae bacterium]
MGSATRPRRLRRLGTVVLLVAVALALGLTASRGGAAVKSGGTWQNMANPPSFNPGAMYLLTDGTVMVYDQGQCNCGSGKWWKLTPDSKGSYVDGTWSQAASLSYAGLYWGSAVLPDGRLIVEGADWIGGTEVWGNQGSIYDPVANTWTAISPPDDGAGNWSRIGDAPSVVLPSGRFMVGASGYSGTKDEAILDASNLTWTTTGDGKADGNGEEGFTLLPNGRVLAVQAKPQSCSTQGSELYNPSTGSWTSAGLTPQPLVDCTNGEIGPQILMHDGKVFVEGSTPNTALYDVAAGTWSAGPEFPVIGGKQYDVADGPGVLLPDGNVLVGASPGNHLPSEHFFLFDGTKLTQIADNTNWTANQTSDSYMLMLPTGQVLFTNRLGTMDVYTDAGTPNAAWAPTVGSVSSTLAAGGTYTVSGTQLNGLSETGAFGDDYNPSTDYPLVRITNTVTGHVVYARTSGMSNRSIAPGASSSTKFTLPSGIQDGASQLRVVANGIASAPASVTVSGGTPLPKPVACIVPKLKGKSLSAARSALTKAHCRLGKVTKKFSSSAKKGRVISQKPSPGKHLAKGAKVAVAVSKGKK